MDRFARAVLLSFCLLPATAFALGNGNLQIHFMDVGQGDGAILISPGGETVMFDDGVSGHCDKPLAYLATLGLRKIGYHVASHYHSDHIGCLPDILAKYPLENDAFDRGGSYNSPQYKAYATAAGKHRHQPVPGTQIILDQSSSNPVIIDLVALNGDGVQTTNENDLSLVAVIHYGNFDAEIGGDLSGYNTSSYNDIETSVAPKVGQVEVYKVHHHGSKYSSNPAWMQTIHPKVAVVSEGTGNSYGHPTQDCMDRIHQLKTRVYWTESGAGATPNPAFDTVSNGAVVVQAPAGGRTFSVTYGGGKTDTYPSW